MKYPKADFMMILLLVLVFVISLFYVLKPTNLLSIASEDKTQQSK